MNDIFEIRVNGERVEYYKNGLFHRDDGPAIEYKCGTKYWYKDNILHREDGPAIIYAFNNAEYWFLYGREISFTEHSHIIMTKKMEKILNG